MTYSPEVSKRLKFLVERVAWINAYTDCSLEFRLVKNSVTVVGNDPDDHMVFYRGLVELNEEDVLDLCQRLDFLEFSHTKQESAPPSEKSDAPCMKHLDYSTDQGEREEVN